MGLLDYARVVGLITLN